MLFLIRSLFLILCISCLKILSSVWSPNSQSFAFSRSRCVVYDTSPGSCRCLLNEYLGCCLFFFGKKWLLSFRISFLQSSSSSTGCFRRVSLFLVRRRFWERLLCLSWPWFQNISFLLRSLLAFLAMLGQFLRGCLESWMSLFQVISRKLRLEFLLGCLCRRFLRLEVCTMSGALDNFFFLFPL